MIRSDEQLKSILEVFGGIWNVISEIFKETGGAATVIRSLGII